MIIGICSLLLLLSLFLTYGILLAAIRHNIMDVPNHRSSHDNPTPRGGGLAIVICWYTGIVIMHLQGLLDRDLFLSFLPGIILAITGLLDDIYRLKPWIRLASQCLTAGLALYFLGGIDPVGIRKIEISSPIILYPVTFVGVVWFINLFNFLDGTDGYSSVEAIVISILLFILSHNAVNLVLISSIVGFLYWNWPRAKIFMGDIGSTQLGFILVVLGLYFHNNSQILIIHWLMISSLFWFDATLTLFRRWRNKEILSVAHRKHAYQRVVQGGLTHQNTILFSIAINLVIASLVFISRKYEFLLIPSLIFNLVFLYGITFLIDKRVPFEKSQR